ncbi:MAG: hypothetical protein GEU96_10905 [Propionibacteriales bacterium]|nr:hypothetical protein [Propionibacteriales bacterium]
MSDFSRDEEFQREWERQYLRSVHAAASVAFERAAWQPAHEVYALLATELRRRGIEPDPQALYSAANLISRGRRPAILQPGTGRRRRQSPGLPTQAESSAEPPVDTPAESPLHRRD